MTDKRVFITGIGLVGDFGMQEKDFFDFIKDPSKKKSMEDLDLSSCLDTPALRRADNTSYYASVAAKLALDDSGIDTDNIFPEKRGLVLGTTHGAIGYSEEYHREIVTGNPALVSPLLFSNSVPNTMASYITNVFNIRGFATTLSGYNAVFSALKCACDLISNGDVDICLTGGVDVFTEILAEPYSFCGLLPETAEEFFGGSGILVLESPDSVKKRKGKVYAEVLDTEVFFDFSTNTHKDRYSLINNLLKRNTLTSCDIHSILTSVFKTNYYKRKYMIRTKDMINVRDCSEIFGSTFSAGEIFEIAYGAFIARGIDREENKPDIDKRRILVNSIANLGIVGNTLIAGVNSEI